MGSTRLKIGDIRLVGNRVKVARLQKEWTMRDMERETGVDAATICRAESGKEPTLTNALRMALGLGYPVEELWELGEEKEN